MLDKAVSVERKWNFFKLKEKDDCSIVLFLQLIAQTKMAKLTEESCTFIFSDSIQLILAI